MDSLCDIILENYTNLYDFFFKGILFYLCMINDFDTVLSLDIEYYFSLLST